MLTLRVTYAIIFLGEIFLFFYFYFYYFTFLFFRHIAGLNANRAKNIIEWREKNGPFVNREQLKKVKGLGPKSFQQCAGFIRINQDYVRTFCRWLESSHSGGIASLFCCSCYPACWQLSSRWPLPIHSPHRGWVCSVLGWEYNQWGRKSPVLMLSYFNAWKGQ